MPIFISLCVLCFHVILTACQFPQHIDLQKISEITFRNDKYNVLKPTIHVTRDHFQDVIQKRFNVNFPTERVFMDKNGFRHYWHGIEYAPNLRKNLRIDNKNINETSHLDTDKKGGTKTVKRIGPKRKQPNRKKKVFEKIFQANVKPKALREGPGTLVKTTFFCPFFGTMTMMSKVDLDQE